MSPDIASPDVVSLSWVDGVVVTLDQRALPHRVQYLHLDGVDALIDAVVTLAVRGAPALGVAGAMGVALSAAAHTDPRRVHDDAARIAAARPTAVNLASGVARALAALPGGPAAVLAQAQAMIAEDALVNHRAAAHAADLVVARCGARPLRILTHCNTGRLATMAHGTALGAVRDLADRGLVREVLVGETRPLLQGARLTAWELAEAGIAHRLVVDSAATWAMATGAVDCVLVGADRVAANGDVANKIGTLGLAVGARHHGIPFIVVATEATRDPATATGAQIVVEQRADDEVTGFGGRLVAPEGTATFNPAFDVTAAKLITAVITEEGVVHGADSAENGTALARVCAQLHGLGWMPGTAGNVSVRTRAGALITASGLAKGELTAADVVEVGLDDSRPLRPGRLRPSAEAAIHTAIYRATGAAAVVHAHPPSATALASRAHDQGVVRWEHYELIKGMGVTDPAAVEIPLFANWDDVARIGADVAAHLLATPQAPPALLIVGHGATTWGENVAQARDRMECLEALSRLALLSGPTAPTPGSPRQATATTPR